MLLEMVRVPAFLEGGDAVQPQPPIKASPRRRDLEVITALCQRGADIDKLMTTVAVYSLKSTASTRPGGYCSLEVVTPVPSKPRCHSFSIAVA